jgi:hypothetical protein
MEELTIPRPAAGEHLVVGCVPCETLVVQFSTDEMMLEDVEGGLLFTFDTGGSVELRNFYFAYAPETAPDFAFEDVVIGGEEFFAMREELMPEAAFAGSGNTADASSLLADCGSLTPPADQPGVTEADMAAHLLNTTGIL